MFATSSPYNLWRVLASIYSLFIPSSVFHPPHPCFIPSSVFYPLIRNRIRAIRIRIRVFIPTANCGEYLVSINLKLTLPWQQ